VGKSLLLAAVALALVGCGENRGEGGGDGPSRDDASTIKAMLLSGAEVQRAAQPLYFCLPENVRCYTRAGPKLVTVAEQERERFEAALDDTDNECLAGVGRLYGDSLAAYADAGRAASAGKPSAFDAAISRSTQIEIRYTRKLDECGFSQGRAAQFGAAIREVNVDLLRISDEIYKCRGRACVLAAARRMRDAARRGQRVLDDFNARLADEAPACLRNAMTVYRGAFVAVERTALAIQAEDFARAEKEGTRAGRLEVRAQRDLAACLESEGV
jgi:hypothetical protein